MGKIKAIVKRTDEEYGHMTWISNTLENLQRTVGGYIEAFPVDEKNVIICNEEGRIKNLPCNCTLFDDKSLLGLRIPLQTFYGDIIVVGTDGDEFADVQIDLKRWRFLIGRED